MKVIKYKDEIIPDMIARRIPGPSKDKIYRILGVMDELIIKGYNVYVDEDNRIIKVTINGAHHPSLKIPEGRIRAEEFLRGDPPEEGEMCILFDGLLYTKELEKRILNLLKCYEWGANSHWDWRDIEPDEVEYEDWGEDGMEEYMRRLRCKIENGKDLVTPQPPLRGTVKVTTSIPKEISILEKVATIIFNDFRFVKNDILKFIDHIRSGRQLK